MTKIALLFSCLLCSFCSLAQNNADSPDYKNAVKMGLGELQKEQCAPCLEAYERALALSQHSVLSYLRAARCAQLCAQNDKAKNFSESALRINPALTAQILQNAPKFPELDAFITSKLGKNLLKKAQKLNANNAFKVMPTPE